MTELLALGWVHVLVAAALKDGKKGGGRRYGGGARYFDDRRSLIEFENLIDETPKQAKSVISDHEKELLKSKKYDVLVEEQHEKDAEFSAQAAQKEEELELEEEVAIEARREAAKIMKLAHSPDIINPARLAFKSENWLGENPANWNVAGGDYHVALQNDAERKQGPILKQVQPGVSTGPKFPQARDRLCTLNSTPPSSIDLEWENEEGFPTDVDDTTSLPISDTASCHSQHSTPASNVNELEWDGDFSSARISDLDLETEQLIQEIEHMTSKALDDDSVR